MNESSYYLKNVTLPDYNDYNCIKDYTKTKSRQYALAGLTAFPLTAQ